MIRITETNLHLAYFFDNDTFIYQTCLYIIWFSGIPSEYLNCNRKFEIVMEG